jgi:hypothetical protein
LLKRLPAFGNIRLKGRILEVFHCIGKGGCSPTSYYISFGPGHRQQKEIRRQRCLLSSGQFPVGTLKKGKSDKFF